MVGSIFLTIWELKQSNGVPHGIWSYIDHCSLRGLSSLTTLLRKFVHETCSSSIKCVLQGMVDNIQLNEIWTQRISWAAVTLWLKSSFGRCNLKVKGILADNRHKPEKIPQALLYINVVLIRVFQILVPICFNSIMKNKNIKRNKFN